jgi:hypothetical protein
VLVERQMMPPLGGLFFSIRRWPPSQARIAPGEQFVVVIVDAAAASPPFVVPMQLQ